MENISLKYKLIIIISISLILNFFIISIGWVYYKKIEKNNVLKTDISKATDFIREARIAEKAYLQYYDISFIKQLDSACKSAEEKFNLISKNNTIIVDDLIKIIKKYNDLFKKIVEINNENEQLTNSIISSNENICDNIDKIVSDLTRKEFQLQLDAENLSKTELSFMKMLRDARLMALMLQVKYKSFLLKGDNIYVNEFLNYFNKYSKSTFSALNQIAKALKVPEFIETSSKFENMMNEGSRAIVNSQELLKTENNIGKELDNIGKELLDTSDKLSLETQAQANIEKNKAVKIIISILLIGSIIFLVLSILLLYSIINPINITTNMLKDIAEGEGDLTKRLNIDTKDEIGTLAGYFNLLMGKLRIFVREVNENTNTLSGSSIKMTNTANTMATNTENVGTQSSTVAAATEELSANLNNVAVASEEMSKSVTAVAAAIEEMSSSLSDVSKNCLQASKIASEADNRANITNETMNHLNSSATEIGKVLDTINDIADQTNLLALNATIEAASAGDAGKGFAVVANEVKELAKQTAIATDEIGHQIEQMQTNTQNAVKAIADITSIIKQINDITQIIASTVEEQSATINEIAQNIDISSSAAGEITNNIQQASAGSNEISSSIQKVNASSNDMVSEAFETKSNAESLSKMTIRLQELVKQFKV